MKVKLYSFADTDIIDNYIRVVKKQKEELIPGSLKMIDLVPASGIYAIVGNMEVDQSTAIQSYLFDKSKWTLDSANKWVWETEEKGEIVQETEGPKNTILKITDLLSKISEALEEKNFGKSPSDFTPPDSGNAPEGVKSILKAVYGECRVKWSNENPNDIDNQNNKQSCASQAWGAVKNAGWDKDENGNWNKKNSEPELKTITGVEIFATGEHNGDKYSIDDLKEMEKNFEPLKQILQPYVKLGHDPDQKLVQQDGMPAAGWIDRIYVAGNKLLADIVDMPKVVYDLVKRKAYKRISSEIYFNLKDKDTIYKKALKAISLLGGDTPAVGSLADVQALYARAYKTDSQFKTYSFENNEKDGVSTMSPEEMMKQIQALIQEVSALKEQLASMGAAKVEVEKKAEEMGKEKDAAVAATDEVKKEYAKLKTEIRAKEIESMVEKLVTDKKITPAEKDTVKAMYEKQDQVKLYSKDDKSEDLVTKLFSERNPLNLDQELSENQKKDFTKNEEEKSKQISEAKSYSEAKAILLKEAE